MTRSFLANLRTRNEYAALANAAAWATGGYARTKRVTATRLAELLPLPVGTTEIDQEGFEAFFLGAFIEGLERREAHGGEEAEDLTDAEIRATVAKELRKARHIAGLDDGSRSA